MMTKKTYNEHDRFFLEALINLCEGQKENKPSLENYVSILEYVLNTGKFFQSIPFNYNILIWVIKRIRSIQNIIVKGNIYTNSMALCLADSTNKINYFEGFVMCNGTISPHAWCELDGRVIDINSEEDDQGIIGNFKKSSYFGVHIKKAKVRENYLKQVELLKGDYKQGVLNYLEKEILSINKLEPVK